MQQWRTMPVRRLVSILGVASLLSTGAVALDEAQPLATTTACIESRLDVGDDSVAAMLHCIPGLRRADLTTVKLSGSSSAQCSLYSQRPVVIQGSAPLDFLPATVWGALSVCDVDAVHVWIGQLRNVDLGTSLHVHPSISEGPTRLAVFRVEQPCLTTPDGSYVVSSTAQYKPLELTALPVSAANVSAPEEIICPLS